MYLRVRVCVLQGLTSVIVPDSSLPENTPKKTNACTEAWTHLCRCVHANMRTRSLRDPPVAVPPPLTHLCVEICVVEVCL